MDASTATYSNVFEERSDILTTKLPLEIEFRKRSIEYAAVKCYITLWIQLLLLISIYSYEARANSYEELLVTLRVNYQESSDIIRIIKSIQNKVFIPYDTLISLGLEEQYLTPSIISMRNTNYCDLSKLVKAEYKLDGGNLVLYLTVPISAIKKQTINIEKEREFITSFPFSDEKEQLQDASHGAFLNYDATFSERLKAFSSLEDFNYFTPGGIFNQTILTRHLGSKRLHQNTRYNKLVRLDTSWTINNEMDIVKLKIGDSITKPADWSGAARFAGIQYATDFSIRPNIITYPLLNYSGTAELPTTLDIYANNQAFLYSNSNIKQGEFDLTNIPLPTGRGDVVIKATDITGKVQTFVMPYYVSPKLLKTGLKDFSFSAGSQRFNYGSNRNDRYKYFVSNVDYSLGVTDNFTNSVHFESQQIASAGNTIYYKLGEVGIFSTSLATNLKSKFHGAQKVSFGFEFNNDRYFFNSNISFGGKNFIDTFNNEYISKGTNLQTGIGYSHDKLGNFSINYLSYPINGYHNYRSKNSRKVKFLNFNYDKRIRENISVRINGGKSIKGYNNNYVILSLVFDFKDNSYAQLSKSRQRKRSSYNLYAASPVKDNLGWGYQVGLGKGQTNKYDIKLSANTSKINSNVYLYKYDRESYEQLNFSGGIIALDKNIFFTQPIYNSFALVKAEKIKDIPVYRNNNLATYTDASGSALVPNLPAYVKSKISLDIVKIPLNTSLSTNELTVKPKWKAGTIARFDTRKTRSLQMNLVNKEGNPIAYDSDVTIDDEVKGDIFVGYDGLVYIDNINGLKTLQGKACKNNNCCKFKTQVDNTERLIDLGNVICD